MFPIRDLNPTRIFPVVTLALIALNIVIFFFWQPGGEREADFVYAHAAIACEVTTGQPLTANQYEAKTCTAVRGGVTFFPEKQVNAAVLVSMFLHGGLLHLAGNMWFLWLFGNNIEEAFGSVLFVAFYLIAGVAAALGFVALHPDNVTPLVGASGAIAGVLGAYFVLFPTRWVLSLVVFILLPVPAIVFLGLWFAMQFAVQDPGVAWESHVTGFVFGAAIALVCRPFLLARLRRIHNG